MTSMFGALNRFISRLDAAPLDGQPPTTNGAFGFQVLRNANQEVPLEPWFDFIIGINGRTIVSLVLDGVSKEWTRERERERERERRVHDEG